MSLGAGCPRCAARVSDADGTWRCPDHAVVTPLWRPEVVDYDGFADHLRRARPLATLAPWPLPPGWVLSDFGSVAVPGHDGRASVLTCSGPTDLDGVVELSIVSEEPGVGLGARCAGARRTDPGAEIGEGPPHAKVRIGGHPIPLWSVPTSDADPSFDRSVFAGEAHGCWLWLVFRPASAALLLKDAWSLVDLADLGPELVDLPFGAGPPAW